MNGKHPTTITHPTRLSSTTAPHRYRKRKEKVRETPSSAHTSNLAEEQQQYIPYPSSISQVLNRLSQRVMTVKHSINLPDTRQSPVTSPSNPSTSTLHVSRWLYSGCRCLNLVVTFIRFTLKIVTTYTLYNHNRIGSRTELGFPGFGGRTCQYLSLRCVLTEYESVGWNLDPLAISHTRKEDGSIKAYSIALGLFYYSKNRRLLVSSRLSKSQRLAHQSVFLRSRARNSL